MNGDEQRARAALEEVGLGWAAGRHPRDLSSGERERLALAAVAVAEPDLLVLDEPTRGLDPARKAELGALAPRLRRVREGGPRRDARPRPPGRPADRTLCFRNTSLSGRRALASRVAALAAGAALALAAWAALDPARGGIATLLAAFAVLVAGFAWLEGGTLSARDLTLVATLGGLAAAGRVLFAPVPSVQPVTVIVAAAGVALGPRRGFAVGALAAIASNFFLGQGPHTPWQMLAWGGCGLLAGLAAAAAPPPARVRGLRAPARLRVRDADGPLALVRLLPAHGGGAAGAARRRRPVQRRSRGRETSSSRSSPGRSCGACSSASSAAPGPRSCGREAARGAGRSGRARDAGRLRPGTAARGRRLRRRADHGLGDARAGRRRRRDPAGRGRVPRAAQPANATDAALVAMARAAAGDRPDDLLPRLRAHRPGSSSTRRSGRSWRSGRRASPCPAGARDRPAGRAALERRLAVARRRRGGRERHGRGDPGAPRRRG